MRALLLSGTSPLAFNNAAVIGAPGYVTPVNPMPLQAEVNAAMGLNTAGDELMTRAKDSARMVDYWDKSDDIVDGYDAVRRKGQIYLPMFEGETADEYKERLALTKFTNVYRDIVESLSAKPFEEEITLIKTEADTTPPQEIEDFIKDVDGAGNNITVFLANTFFNGINSAIDWIFVDYPAADPNIRTVADAKASGIRPFWSHVLGRNVFRAVSKVINGKETLTYIRIYEPGDPDHVRVFERSDDGIVTWKLWRKIAAVGNERRFVLADSGTISIGIIPLVPFITGRRDGRTFYIHPPMRDAADLQIELYQQESGLKFIKTLAAYPMLAANGFRPEVGPDGKPLPLARGPRKILWGKPDASGNIGNWAFVEPGSQSMEFLAKDVKSTIDQLRELGRQPLTAQSGNLTVITTAVAAGKAKSAVGAWAMMLADTAANALYITSLWLGIPGYEPQVNVYDEFDEYNDDGKDLDALATAREKKDISRETYLDELKRRRVLRSEFDAAADLVKILAEVPTGDTEGELDDDKNAINNAG